MDTSALTAGAIISHYRIVEKLGAGGMGEVYLAEDTRLNRRVALKVLPTESVADEQARKRLFREAQAAATLDHPNICTVHEVGEEDGCSFIVMQYVDGETLAARIQRKQMKIEEALDVAVQVADALAEAHSRGIIHRDIKPANIMLTPRGQVKVMDFGLAKVIGNELADASKAETASLLTEPGTVVGTVPYMSPEQLRGEQLDARSDVFSFGAMLYETVSGRQAFGAESAAATISAILTTAPLPLARYASDVPEELHRIVLKCLEKDRERRYQTTRDLAIDLENLRREFGTSRIVASHSEAATAYKSVTPTDANVKPRSFPVSRRALAVIALLVMVAAAALAYLLVFRGTTVTRQPEIKSLAVLPFKSLNPEAKEDYLGLGIADTIITKVSQIGELNVRPTNAVRKYASQDLDPLEAARQLKVDSVLDGTVQRDRDRLRVNVNLLRVSNGGSLWAETFYVTSADLFGMQDEVSRQVAARLRLKLSPKEATRLAKHYASSAEAHDYYLRGMYSYEKWSGASSKSDVEAAIAMFRKAIDIDQNYPLAHAQLAYCYAVMGLFFEPGTTWLDRANQEMDQARALDPDLGLLHEVRSEILWSRVEGFNIEQAIRELRLAGELDPSVGHASLGILYAHIGLDEESSRELERALEIDPTSMRNQNRMAESNIWFGRYGESVSGFDRLIEMDPGNPGHYAFSAIACLYQRDLAEARRRIDRALALKPDDPIALSDRALLAGLMGRFREAEAEIPAIVQKGQGLRSFHHAAYNIACVYALEGRVKDALEWLRKTAETGMPNYPLFARDPTLDGIRKDQTFIQFMEEMKTRWERYRREFGEVTTR